MSTPLTDGDHGPGELERRLLEVQLALEAEVAERRRVEEMLRQSEDEYRTVFEHAPLGLTTFDESGGFLQANQAFCAMMGYSEEELRNMTFLDLTHPDDIDPSLAPQDPALSVDASNTIRRRYVRRDGRIVDAIVHLVSVPASTGRSGQIVAQVEDVTRRTDAEGEVRRLRERLSTVSRMSTLGEMAGGLAHEVNQPLTAIAAYAQACLRMSGAGTLTIDDATEAVKKIDEEALRAGEIIRGLRQLVRQRESDRENCDVNELIRSAVRISAPDARLRGVGVTVQLDEGIPPVLVDAVQIQQVLLNLIRNAVESSADAGAKESVVVRSASDSEGGVLLAVEDQGVGIPEAEEASLFRTFYTTKDSGLGLGLSISRSIVSSHGGALWFQREPGAGTTFVFTLPGAPSDE